MIKLKILTSIISLFIMGNCLISGYNAYLIDQSNIKFNINNIWKQTVISDCSNRLAETGVLKMHLYSPAPSSTINIVTKDKSITINKKDTSQVLTSEASDYQADQIYLSRKNPIRVHKLDSVFQTLLKKSGYTFQTTVSYYNGSETFYSNNNTSFYIQSYPVEWMNTIAEGFIVINGYVKLRPSDYLQQYKRTCLFWGISLIFLLFLLLYLRKSKAIVEKTKSKCEAEENHTSKVEPMIVNDQQEIHKNEPIKESILVHLDCAKDTLIYGDNTINLTTLVFNLFHFLSKGKEYFQTYEDIYIELWGKEGGDKKRLEQIVIRLRNELKVIPEIKIVAIRGCGYQVKTDDGRGIMIEYTNDDEQKITPI